MPCTLMLHKWQIYLFLQTIKYALYIYGRYVSNLIISPSIKYALHIRGRCATDLLLSPTIQYVLYINGRYVTDLHISPHLCMPCIFMADMRYF